MATADKPLVEVRHKTLLTLSVMAAMLMQVLDGTIANVALPHMQASLSATQDSINWVLTSYIIAAAIALPLTGWLSERIGARQLFLLSCATFIIASALCGISSTLPEMVAFRLIQGVAGSFIGPLAQTIMLDINRPSEHAKAMSIYGMGVMIGPILGPMLGGWLTENFDWRWVFFVNLPVGIICLVGLWLLLPKPPISRRPFDMMGWAMIAIGLSGLQLMLDRGQHVDWFNSTEIWVEAGIAASAFWMFMVHMATSKNPLFPPAMLRDRNLMTGVFFMAILGLVTMSAMALLPTMMQTLYGYPVVDTGVILASRGAGVFIAMALTGRLSHVLDARVTVSGGFCIMAASLWLMTGWSLEIDWHPIVISGFVQGIGLGLIFVPLNVLSFSTLPPAYRTDGASLFGLSRSLGASVGIAVASALLTRNVQVSHADIAANLTQSKLLLNPALARGFGTLGGTGMSMLDAEVNRQALMIAYLDDFKFMLIATLCTLPLLVFIRKPPKRTGGEDILPMLE
jgi:DHA2 family multidrug resistance protein